MFARLFEETKYGQILLVIEEREGVGYNLCIKFQTAEATIETKIGFLSTDEEANLQKAKAAMLHGTKEAAEIFVGAIVAKMGISEQYE